jgi:hypothetical protein
MIQYTVRQVRNAKITTFWNGWLLIIAGVGLTPIGALRGGDLRGNLIGTLAGFVMAACGAWAVRSSCSIRGPRWLELLEAGRDTAEEK